MKLQKRIRERVRQDEIACGVCFLLAALLTFTDITFLRVLAVVSLGAAIFFMVHFQLRDDSEAHRIVKEELLRAKSNAMSYMNVIGIGLCCAGILVSIISQGPAVPYFKITMICFFLYLGLEHLLTGISIDNEKERSARWQF